MMKAKSDIADISSVTTQSKIIVVKIGTSSLTDGNGVINREAVKKLCAEIAELKAGGHDLLVVSSGAIAAGMPELGLDNDRSKVDMRTLQAAATVGQCSLMSVYREALAEHGLTAGQVLLVPLDFIVRTQYVHAAATLRRLLELGAVPIINENDAVADDEIRWGDNDRIAALVANLVDADLLVLLTDIAGVFTEDPRHSTDPSLIAEIINIDSKIDSQVGGPGTARGSGGMASKVTAARVASWSGVTVVIADAQRPRVLADSVAGKIGVGTIVHPRKTHFSARKLWIGFAVGSMGAIVVDDGARTALERHKSLLAVGVLEVIGDFEAGSPVEVRAEDGTVFAKGLCRHGSRELRGYAGQRSDVLPTGTPNVVIHANDLVVLPETDSSVAVTVDGIT